MSNTSEKLAIANVAYFSIGHTIYLDAIDDTTVEGKQMNAVIESVIKELMSDDWYFNRHQVLLEDMTQIYKLTIDAAPSSAWSIGDTITGQTSGVTCEVIDVLSDTVYLVTEPSGDWTDGEVLSNGTGTRDCATGYPQDTEDIDIDQYQYGFLEPTDCLYIRGIFDTQHDKAKYKHKMYKNIVLSHYAESCWFKYNYYRTESEGVADVTGIKPWFHRLISAKLAFMLSANITENQKIRSKAEIDYQNAYLKAKEKNGSEEGAIDWSGHDDWAEGANRQMEIIGNDNYFSRRT